MPNVRICCLIIFSFASSIPIFYHLLEQQRTFKPHKNRLLTHKFTAGYSKRIIQDIQTLLADLVRLSCPCFSTSVIDPAHPDPTIF
jgi:hypothetical protein